MLNDMMKLQVLHEKIVFFFFFYCLWLDLRFDDLQSDEVLPRFDGDMESHLGTFSTENVGIWVPQAPPPLLSSSQMNRAIGQNENNIKGSRSRLKDDNFTVPQISPQSNSKRGRFLW